MFLSDTFLRDIVKKIFASFIFLLFLMMIFSFNCSFDDSVKANSESSFPLEPTDDVIVHSLDFLQNSQSNDGSIGGFTVSAWAAMAIFSAEKDPNNWGNLVEYLENKIDLIDEDKATDWERHVLAIVACDKNPWDFGGIDFLTEIMNFYDGQQIGSQSNLYDDFFGIIALVASGIDKDSSVIQSISTFIKNHQYQDGGWGDVDSTSAGIMALITAGEDVNSNHITDALSFIKSKQTAEGGFKSWGDTNAASTSWAIMAIVASGQNPTSDEWENNGNSPVDYLLSLQRKNGCFNWSESQNINSEWMTCYAIPALLGRSYPVRILESDEDGENNNEENEGEGNDDNDDGSEFFANDWTGYIRIEGKSNTVWNGEIKFNNSVISALNDSSGEIEDFNIPYPSVLGALDEASKTDGFSYSVIYYPSWDAFFVTKIADDSDWWHYWVDYSLPMIDAGHYELSEKNKDVLWGYLEDWNARNLRIFVEKQKVNVSEEFRVAVYNRTMVPVEDAVVYVGSSKYFTNKNGNVSISIDFIGDYNIYAEKEGYVRSEKITVSVNRLLEIIKPVDNSLYILNRKTIIKYPSILIIGHIDIKVETEENVEKVDFFIDDELRHTDSDAPFKWRLNDRAFFDKKTIMVKAYTNNNEINDKIEQIIKSILSLSENHPAKQLFDKIISFLQSLEVTTLNPSDVDEKEVEIINILPRLHIL